ncbi:MAG: serine/threonine protein kinase [Deltaproteobacteria bacterium]|nr:serine/threonine protein kinase [Deltaproteobacteria bacterium]
MGSELTRAFVSRFADNERTVADRERGKPSGLAAGTARRRQRETAADRARIGSVIAGSYRIDEIIGRGAIGAVFGGVHLRLERPVAVKFVDPSLVDDPEIRARFKREAKIAAQIGSSHAVEVFDYGLGEDGAPYLVMERLYGEDLHARMQREGRLPVDRALRIAKQVCRALGAAHATGIVHRDLKPENVFLVERDGEQEFVKVVDFGLSTFVQSDDTRLTRAGQSVGTPLYMAPEQAGAHAFDARVDVYSLGVLIFEMTTGRLPFEAATLQALLVALATQPPRSARYYCPDLPIELDDLVLRFIARDPRVRPKSAAAALAEIIALEERLAAKGHAHDQTSGSVRVRDVGIDGLPGQLPGAFAQEVSGLLDEMRRTGRLVASEVDASSDALDTAPVSSGADRTRPMDRRELNDLMAEAPSIDSIKLAPRAAGRPAKASGPRSVRGEGHRGEPRHGEPRQGEPQRTSPPPQRTSPPAQRTNPPPQRPSPRKVPIEDDVIEEDSGVFYGRIDTSGKPQAVRHDGSPHAPTIPPAAPRRAPPPMVIALALAAFLIVAALVLVRVLR